MLNVFEHTKILNDMLPDSWRDNSTMYELEEFLQANWLERKSLYNDEFSVTKQMFINFLSHGDIKTNKYIGTIIFKGEQLNIFPKVFDYSNNDNTNELNINFLVNNLVKWLEYSNKFNYPYINATSELSEIDSLKELFVTIFVNKLENILNRSGFYRYEEKNEVVSSIKGKLDIIDYYTKQYANGKLDKFRCQYSSFEFDNLLNRIIKYTCRVIYSDTRVRNQIKLRNILNKLNDVTDVKCLPSDCDKIKINKMHSHYNIILSICKMFLINNLSNFNFDKSNTLCFLFPTDLLFEGFIGGYIQEYLANSAKVRLQASNMKLIDDVIYKNVSFGNAFTMRHDILCEFDKKIIILDTKYKLLNRFDNDYNEDFKASLMLDIMQDDLYQMFTYAIKRNCNDVFLLYPLRRLEELEPSYPILRSIIPIINNDNSAEIINIHLVRIPFVFELDESITINKINNVLLDIFREF